MKTIACFIFLLTLSVYTQAQNNCPADTNAPISTFCEQGRGIRTDPDNPHNDACPNLENDFEWMVKHTPGGTAVPKEYYYIYGPNVGDNPVLVRNPFNGPSDANYSYFLTANHGSNYLTEDGWELLKVEFGSLSNVGLSYTQAPGKDTVSNVRPQLPYMMLYNRFSGTLRFFAALIMEQDNTYKTVRIELRIPSTAPQGPHNYYQDELKATNLLSIQGKSIQPLDQESDETALSVFVKYSNNRNVFLWFDIPVAYDPCLCNNRSQLDVSFRFVQTADIDITGSLTGTIKTESNGSENYAKMVFGRVLAAGVSGALAIKTGGAVVNFKAFVDLVDIVNHPSRPTQEQNNLTALKNYLTCNEEYAKILKGNFKDVSDTDQKKQYAAAQKILDGNTTFLSSLVKGCSTGDKGATVITGDIKAKGTFTLVDAIPGTRISLTMPGSNWSDKDVQSNAYSDNGKLVPAYATYNERLGTFALLKTPRLQFFTTDGGSFAFSDPPEIGLHSHYFRRAWSMKLVDEDLEYAFNPLLHINPAKTTILVRFVIDKDAEYFDEGGLWSQVFYPYCFNTNTACAVMNIDTSMNSEYRLATPFMPLDYVTNMPVRLSWGKSVHATSHIPGGPAYDDSFTSFTSFEENMFIQFSIIGESYEMGSDGTPNDFVQLLTFPLNFLYQTVDPNGNTTNGSYVQEIKVYDQDVIFTETEDFFFTGPVIISAKLSSSTGKTIRIFSLNGFEIEPGGEVSPDIELIGGPHWEKRPQPARTFAQISGFCGDTSQYKAQDFATAALEQEKEEYQNRKEAEEKAQKEERDDNLKARLIPNPTKDQCIIRFDMVQKDVQIAVLDINGKLVYHNDFKGENLNIELSLSELQAGVYIVNIVTASGEAKRIRLVKL